MNLFKKKKYTTLTKNQVVLEKYNNEEASAESAPSVPDGLWVKCDSCEKIVYTKELGEKKICPKCNHYFRLSARDRIQLIADENSFVELDSTIKPKNPMNYPNYEKKIEKLQDITGLNDAVITGECNIENNPTIIGAMDSNFIMGSMGSVVGEKLTRAFEKAIEKRLPVVIFTASGGARMQEGIISLMQMAKVSAAVKKHSDEGLLYTVVLTDPTTGGVTASFGMLGDIILAEPRAIVGFAGRRVIEQTIKQSLPDQFQTSEFLLEHGFVDKIVNREDLKNTLGKILSIHEKTGYIGRGDKNE